MRAAVLLAAAATAAAQSTRPNFIFMLVDDVGIGDVDLGLPYANSPARTPNLLAMGQSPNSIVFNRFYSGGAVCSPTRSTMLTGRTSTRECIINVEQNALPRVLNSSVTAATMKDAGYATGFFGKWHIGSMSNSNSTDDCYKPTTPSAAGCSTGYVWEQAVGLCCDGRDAHVAVAPPSYFGFDTVVATPQVAPTSTANCGCIYTVPGAGGENCNIGHYEGAGHSTQGNYLECDQYFTNFNGTANATMQPLREVSPVDDAEFLVDALETFIVNAVANNTPFFAQLSFHNCHIPYIAPPAFRAQYAGQFDLNHQDYYGCLTDVDAQVGRIRALLSALGVQQNTWLSLTSDNGPEIDGTPGQAAGHDTTGFENPGSSGGLTGRKRALTEGGIRLPGIIEFPPLIKGNRIEPGYFPASTMDYYPTLLDMLGKDFSKNSLGWPIDGTSLLPLLRGTTTNRTQPIGWTSDFVWQLTSNGTVQVSCADRKPSAQPPSMPNGFTTPFKQPQLAWTEGALKLFACFPGDGSDGNWRWSLYDVVTDPTESNDLWPTLGSTVGDAMFTRFYAWMQSVANSVVTEDHCVIGGREL
jgi:arylsulfatase A-like enzyme